MSAIDRYRKNKSKYNYDPHEDITEKWAKQHEKIIKHAFAMYFNEMEREREKQKMINEVMEEVRKKEDVIADELGKKIKEAVGNK